MRFLLESSWTKFGPAGRDSLDWTPGSSALPSTDRQAPGQSSSGAFVTASSLTYIVVAAVSFLLLAAVIFLLLRRKQGFGLDGKVGLTEVIALEDLKDPKRNSELLSSLRRSRRQHRAPSCSSEQEDDAGDGVFLMVYLPSPYEQTLTRIARAASTSSSKDAESPTLSPGPEDGDHLRLREAASWSEEEKEEETKE